MVSYKGMHNRDPKIDQAPTRNAQTIPSCVISFRILSGPRIYERLQTFQLPTRDTRRDLARPTRWSAFLHSRWRKVCIFGVLHAP